MTQTLRIKLNGVDISSKIISITGPSQKMNAHSTFSFVVGDANSSLYDSYIDGELAPKWADCQFLAVTVQDYSDDEYLFIGRVETPIFSKKSATIMCVGESSKLKDKPISAAISNYIYAEGKVVDPSYDGNDDQMQLSYLNDVAFSFAAATLIGKGVLIDDSTDETMVTWIADSVEANDFDTVTNTYTNTQADDDVFYTQEQAVQGFPYDPYTSHVDINLTGTTFDVARDVTKVEVFWKVYLTNAVTGTFPDLPGFNQYSDFRLYIYDYVGTAWVELTAAYMRVSGNAVANTIIARGNFELTEDVDKYVDDDGSDHNEIRLKIEMVSKTEPRNWDTEPYFDIDYLKVDVTYQSGTHSPMQAEITDNADDWIDCDGETFETDNVAVGDLIQIGSSTTDILNDIALFNGLVFDIDPNLSKFIARNFKGMNSYQILNSICLIEDAFWWEDFTDGSPKIYIRIRGSWLTTIPLANYDPDVAIERRSNIYSSYRVMGNPLKGVDITLSDESINSPRQYLIIDESINTQPDAYRIATTYKNRFDDVQPSFKIKTSEYNNSSFKVGHDVTITLADQGIDDDFVIRRVDFKYEFPEGMKTTILYCGLGNTPKEEHFAEIMKNLIDWTQRGYLNRQNVATLVTALSHNDLTNVTTDQHHTKYTDAEVNALIDAAIVGGEAIDNAIDALIAAHASDDDAHHAKYTDSDVEDVISTSLDGGGAIDTHVDGLIATHAGDDDAHHEVFENLIDDDSPQLGADLDVNGKAITDDTEIILEIDGTETAKFTENYLLMTGGNIRVTAPETWETNTVDLSGVSPPTSSGQWWFRQASSAQAFNSDAVVTDADLDLDVDTYFGRDNVLKMENNDGSLNLKTYYTMPSADTHGMVEFWFRIPSTSADHYFILGANSANKGWIYLDNGVLKYYDSGYHTTAFTASINVWYHAKLSWDFTTDSYDGNGADRYSFYVNGTKYIDNKQFWTLATGVDNAVIDFACAPGADMYIHAFGAVGVNGYSEGDNYPEGGIIYATDFVEETANVNQIGIDEINAIDFDAGMDKSQYPVQVRQGSNGLGIGQQIRWLERCVKEGNYWYMNLFDVMIEKNNRLEARIEKLEKNQTELLNIINKLL